VAQVPGSAFSFQDVVNVFGGSGSFADYYRGGPYVPNIPQNYAIADNPSGLELVQFANATNYVPFSASASGGTASYNIGLATSPKTRFMSTNATATASGGNGSFSYSWRVTGSSGVTGASASGTSSVVSVSCTATLNVRGYVDVACDISDGVSTQTVTARCTFNYYNTV
jgi:hypothetical protein